MRVVRVFVALISCEITMTLRYRWWLAMMQVSNLIAPAISLLVWQGAMSLGARPPVSPQFLTTYLVSVGVVGLLTSSWTSSFLATSIRLGGVSSWLIRPCSTHLASLANNVAEKLVKLVLAAPLAGLLAILFRDQVALPGDVVRWALFTVSILLAAGISFCLDVVVGSLTFWLEDIAAIDRLRTLMARTLSGALIPLALFPAELEELLSIQPFRFVVSFPLEVLLGRPAEGLFVGFAVQFAWFLGFLCAATGCWRLGLRSYQGSGA